MELVALYVDLDGVLADFDQGVIDLLGRPPHKVKPGLLWGMIAKSGNFYETLPMMSDAMELWAWCVERDPTILTGIPRGKWAEPQKRSWVAEKLGEDVEVICCASKDKYKWSGEGHILIDDREKTKASWEEAGGTFILHTSAADTLAQLAELGVADLA